MNEILPVKLQEDVLFVTLDNDDKSIEGYIDDIIALAVDLPGNK